jgi:hypothetical protein
VRCTFASFSTALSLPQRQLAVTYVGAALRQASLEELFRAKGVRPIESANDLACDGVFESGEELEEFIAHTYAARRADLA